MDGLLLKLLEDRTGRPGYWFGRLFGPVLDRLDGLWWHPLSQPWMGAPDDFDEEGPLWRPGSLRRYGGRLAEEFIELWGFESDSPPRLDDDEAAALLLYTDSTCWELYTRLPGLCQALRAGLRGAGGVAVYPSHSGRRRSAFHAAGLAEVWAAMFPGRG